MTVNFKTSTTNQANRIHKVLFTEQIWEISDTGVSVYDEVENRKWIIYVVRWIH